jgi:hypothetical protein
MVVRHMEIVRRGVRPLFGTLRYKLGAVRLELLLVALQDKSLLVQVRRLLHRWRRVALFAPAIQRNN